MVGNLVSVTLKTGSFKNVFVYHPSRVWLMHTLQQIWLSWYKIYTIVSENQSISQTQYSQKDVRNKCLPDQTEPNLRKVLQNEIPHPVRISCLQKFKNNVEEYGFYLTKKLQEHCLKWFQIQTKRKKIEKCPFYGLVYCFWPLASFWTIIYWQVIYKKALQYTNAS